jgi:hypothetical protein
VATLYLNTATNESWVGPTEWTPRGPQMPLVVAIPKNWDRNYMREWVDAACARYPRLTRRAAEAAYMVDHLRGETTASVAHLLQQLLDGTGYFAEPEEAARPLRRFNLP